MTCMNKGLYSTTTALWNLLNEEWSHPVQIIDTKDGYLKVLVTATVPSRASVT